MVVVALVVNPGADRFAPPFLSVALILLNEESTLFIDHVLDR
jgi:hypothetical protein